MSNEQARPIFNQARAALQNGNFEEALALADQAATLDPTDSDTQVFRGISLSQLQRPEEANQAFDEAVRLAPNNPKAYHNYAVHLYGLGRKETAMQLANESLRLDPDFEPARAFADRLAQELGIEPLPRPAPAQPSYIPPPAAVRPGYDADGNEVHSLPWVERLGKRWTSVGWGIAACLLAVTIGVVIMGFPIMMKAASNPAAAAELSKAMMEKYGALSATLQISTMVLALAALLWQIFDIADRRQTFLWLMPMVLPGSCCCSQGLSLHWLVLGIYIIASRR